MKMAEDQGQVGMLEVLRGGQGPLDFISIWGSEQFFIGRNENTCRHPFPDPSISNTHLQFHCIVYEQTVDSKVPPFVYVTDISANGAFLKKANAECVSSQLRRGIRMDRNCKYLLDDGDEIFLSAGSVRLKHHSFFKAKNAPFTPIQEREKQLFSPRYLVTGRMLGEGAYGRVMVGIDQKTQHQVACKIIDLTKLWPTLPKFEEKHEYDWTIAKKTWPERVVKSFREFDILKDLSHPNIIAVQKVFWSSNTFYIFQDLVSGGDLFSYLEYKGGRLGEFEAAVIVRQIVAGVEYLHDHGIVHRDLKPENLLMTSLDSDARVIITDFGNSRFVPTSGRMSSMAGTLAYAAPEIYKRNKIITPDLGYSRSVDMWSIGTITAILLSGEMVFPAYDSCSDDDEGVLASTAICDLSFMDDSRHEVWSRLGWRPKIFIKRLLVLDDRNRLTAAQALSHSWLSNSSFMRDFNILYERSMRDWQPRNEDLRLVEAIWDLSMDIHDESQPSERTLTQQVVSRFFTPQHRSSAHTPSNYFMGSGRQTLEDEYPQKRQWRFSSSAERDSSRQDFTNDSIRHISIASEDDGGYGATNDVQVNESPDYWPESHDIHAGADSIYPFSIPGPPPLTPEVEEEDAVIIPETPTKQMNTHRKRRAVSPPWDRYETRHEAKDRADQRNADTYFSHELSKRRKLHGRYR